jgi:hypothetical protein
MKVSIEINRKEFDELPEKLKNKLLENESEFLSDMYFDDKLSEFIEDLKEKYNCDLTKDDFNYSFGGRGDYISLKASKFESLFWQALNEKCKGDEEIYIQNVELDLRSFGVGYTDFPYQMVEGTQGRAIKVEISEDCPEDIKKDILTKTDDLYSELYNSFLNAYKDLSDVVTNSYSYAEESLKNYYYYLDNKSNLVVTLEKYDFNNVQEADVAAKKEIAESYNKQTKKSKLVL